MSKVSRIKQETFFLRIRQKYYPSLSKEEFEAVKSEIREANNFERARAIERFYDRFLKVLKTCPLLDTRDKKYSERLAFIRGSLTVSKIGYLPFLEVYRLLELTGLINKSKKELFFYIENSINDHEHGLWSWERRERRGKEADAADEYFCSAHMYRKNRNDSFFNPYRKYSKSRIAEMEKHLCEAPSIRWEECLQIDHILCYAAYRGDIVHLISLFRDIVYPRWILNPDAFDIDPVLRNHHSLFLNCWETLVDHYYVRQEFKTAGILQKQSLRFYKNRKARQIRIMRAATYFKRAGYYRKALKLYKKGAELKADEYYAYVNICYLYLELQKPRKAQEWWDRFLTV